MKGGGEAQLGVAGGPAGGMAVDSQSAISDSINCFVYDTISGFRSSWVPVSISITPDFLITHGTRQQMLAYKLDLSEYKVFGGNNRRDKLGDSNHIYFPLRFVLKTGDDTIDFAFTDENKRNIQLLKLKNIEYPYVLCKNNTLEAVDTSVSEPYSCYYDIDPQYTEEHCCYMSGEKVKPHAFNEDYPNFRIIFPPLSVHRTCLFVVKLREPKTIYYIEDSGKNTYTRCAGHELTKVEDKASIDDGGLVKHPCLAENEPVISAGRLFINRLKQTIKFDNSSGHYKPNERSLDIVEKILHNNLDHTWSIQRGGAIFGPSDWPGPRIWPTLPEWDIWASNVST